MGKKNYMKQHSKDIGEKKYTRITKNLGEMVKQGYLKKTQFEESGKIISESYTGKNSFIYLRKLNENTKVMNLLINGNSDENSKLIKALELNLK